MPHNKLHLVVMYIVQYEVSIRSASFKIYFHAINTKDLISKFRFPKKYIFSKNQNKMI